MLLGSQQVELISWDWVETMFEQVWGNTQHEELIDGTGSSLLLDPVWDKKQQEELISRCWVEPFV